MRIHPQEITEAVEALVDGRESIDIVARQTFEYQRAHSQAYARVCERRGVSQVKSWRDVPPVHVDAFRTQRFCTGRCEDAEAVFRTSGTTGNTQGVHYVPDLRLYRESSMRNFEHSLLPVGMPRRMLSLIGPVDELAASSLARMVAWAFHRFGTPESEYIRSPDDLRCHSEPFLLLGTAFGLADFFHAAPMLKLPPGSTIMETGGFKGRTKTLTREDLHAFYRRAGVSSSRVVGEYGMTELSSQWYDGQIGRASASIAERVYVPPPWARTRILDAASMRDVRPGETGLLCHFDPINVGSVQMVLTSDIGRRVTLKDGRDGFIYIGRASGAVIRGCSQLDE